MLHFIKKNTALWEKRHEKYFIQNKYLIMVECAPPSHYLK